MRSPQYLFTQIFTVFDGSLPKCLPFAGGALPSPPLFSFLVGRKGKPKNEKERGKTEDVSRTHTPQQLSRLRPEVRATVGQINSLRLSEDVFKCPQKPAKIIKRKMAHIGDFAAMPFPPVSAVRAA